MAGLLVAISKAFAQEDAATNHLELTAEDKSLWQESLLWTKDIVVRAGFGYKDNVLLSPNSREGSAFFTSGLDLTIYRLPLDGLEVNFSVVGDDVRYLRSPGGLHGEDLFLTSAQVQKYFGGVWRIGLELRHSYIDQVLEELLTTGGARAVEAKGNTLGARPFLRRDLSTNWWVQLEAPLARDWMQSPLDPTWKLGGQTILGFSYAQRSQISLMGGGTYIPHDQWLARDDLGNEIAGRRLNIWREVAELKWEHQWDATNRWATTTRMGFNHSHDNGGGYFDYDRYFLSGDLRFRTSDWEAKVSASASYYHFPVQTVGASASPNLRVTTLDVSLRLERRVYKSIRCFASCEFEQTASNDPTAAYRDHVETAGLSWEF